MVERLKEAIDKARAARTGQAAGSQRHAPPLSATASALHERWRALPEVMPNAARMAAERVIAYNRSHPSFVAFDVLRTRILSACRENGWRSVGVTSATKGCGKSVVSANLAFSVARQHDARAILIDMDMRVPRLQHIIGVEENLNIADFLSGAAPLETSVRRVGRNLALVLNSRAERDASEILQSADTTRTLEAMCAALQPDLVLYDLPPLLAVDDAIGFMPHLDAILLIVAAGVTRAREVHDCERLITEGSNFLGVVLNKQVDGAIDTYHYDYTSE